MKKILSMLAIGLLLSLLAACASAPAGPSAGGNPSTRGDAVVAYVGTAIFETGLDPIKGSMSYGYPFISAALLRVNPASEYVGDIAASWSVSPDALTYTFRLKDGMKFSDGAPLTAADVVFTYETVQARQAENESVDLTRLASVRALSDSEVAFTLTEPYSPFLDATAMLGIVPKAAYDPVVFEKTPIGAGPWRVVQYDANQQIIVEPNPYYADGAASIPRVTLVYMDADAALSAARSGQLDVVMVNPNYADQAVSGMTPQTLSTMDIRMVSLPVIPARQEDGEAIGNDVTCDPAVREALSIGINRAALIKNALSGIGKPAAGFTDNLRWADGAKAADARREEAAALLSAAGWIDADGDGVREKNGLPCAFDLYAAEDRYALAAALAEDAAALGIRITTHSANWDDISKNMRASAVVWGWGQYSPTVLASLFDSRFSGSKGYDNVVSYENPEADAAIRAALNATDVDAANAAWQRLQRVADADFPYLYLVNIEHCYFISDRLDISAGTQIPHPHGHGTPILCNMKDWKLKNSPAEES